MLYTMSPAVPERSQSQSQFHLTTIQSDLSIMLSHRIQSDLTNVYGKSSVSLPTMRRWIEHSSLGKEDMSDDHRAG